MGTLPRSLETLSWSSTSPRSRDRTSVLSQIVTKPFTAWSSEFSMILFNEEQSRSVTADNAGWQMVLLCQLSHLSCFSSLFVVVGRTAMLTIRFLPFCLPCPSHTFINLQLHHSAKRDMLEFIQVGYCISFVTRAPTNAEFYIGFF